MKIANFKSLEHRNDYTVATFRSTGGHNKDGSEIYIGGPGLDLYLFIKDDEVGQVVEVLKRIQKNHPPVPKAEDCKIS